MNSIYDIAKYALDGLKKAGADHAQCIISKGHSDEFNIEDGKFTLLRTLINSEITLRALKDQKKGAININDLSLEAIDAAVIQCMASVESSSPDEAEAIAPLIKNENFSYGINEADKNALFDRMEELVKTIKQNHPKVVVRDIVADFDFSDVLYLNTNGVRFETTGGEYSFSTSFSASENDKTSSFNYFYARLGSLENPLLDSGMLAALVEESEKSIDTKSVEGKFDGTVILTPACLPTFLRMAFGNFLSDSVIIDKTSPWINMLGKQVASEKLSVSSAPLNEKMIGCSRFTNDGYKVENMDIIKNGVLQTFLLSQYGSNKTGFSRSLNSGINYIIAGGEKSLNEIIASVEKGLLVNRFSGGAPSANGDFSGVAKNSFLIEKGKVTTAVSETMISGNLAQMLKSVTAISSEQASNGMTLVPWIAFDGITISGK